MRRTRAEDPDSDILGGPSSLERLCADFEREWKSGRQPLIADYVLRADARDRIELLRRLLPFEIESSLQALAPPAQTDPSVAADSSVEIGHELEKIGDRLREVIQTISSSLALVSPGATPATTLGPNGEADVTCVPANAKWLAPLLNLSVPLPARVGNYEILGEIARGGMGIVFKARHLKLGRFAAVKMIRSGELADSTEIARFYAEAEAASQLDHSGIVPIYEVGEQAGQHYIAMAFVEGQSLWQRVQESPLEPREAARLVRHVADAVQFAHEKGIIHRDLKPQNILLSVGGEPRVTDFGLAKKTLGDSQLTATGQVLGTPAFMPPEQALGNTGQVGAAADIYSLGATLYCLLTGRPPFQAASIALTLSQVINQEPVSPRALNPAIDRDLETICVKCLRKEIGQRYATAADLAEDLARYLAGEPILARPMGRLERGWRWCHKNPYITGLAGSVAVLILVCGVMYEVYRDRTRRDATQIKKEQSATRAAEIERRYEFERAEEKRQRALRLDLESRFDQALALCRQGELPTGLLNLTQVLDEVPSVAPDLERVVRCNLSAWGQEILLTPEKNFETPDNWARCVTFNSDGSRVAAAYRDGSARVWDIATGKSQLLTGPTTEGSDTALFSVDGQTILTSNWGCQMRQFDAATGQLLAADDPPEIETSSVVRLVPDGKHLMLGCGPASSLVGEVRLWDVEKRQLVGKSMPHPGGVLIIAISSDSKRAAFGSWSGVVQIWDLEQGTPIGPQLKHNGKVSAAAFSPDGQTLLTSGEIGSARVGGEIYFWDASSGAAKQSVQVHPAPAHSICFTPDGGRYVTAADDGQIRFWDAQSRQEIGVPTNAKGSVRSIAISTDGTRLAAACRNGTVQVWRLQPHNGGHFMPHGARITSVRSDPRGQILLVCTYDGVLRLWDTTTVRLHRDPLTLPKPVFSAAFCEQGKVYVAHPDSSKILLRWEAATGKSLGESETIEPSGFEGVFDADGGLSYLLFKDGTARRLDPETGLVQAPVLKHEGLKKGALSRDGRTIVTLGTDGPRIWNALTGERMPVEPAFPPGIRALAISPDLRTLACGGTDRNVYFREIATGRPIGQPLLHPAAVEGLVFSPDGKRLLCRCANRTANLWNLETGLQLGMPLIHSREVTWVEFSRDSKFLATGYSSIGSGNVRGQETQFQIWDPETLKPIGPGRYHRDVAADQAGFLPDGRRFMTISSLGTIQLSALPFPIEGTPEQLRAWAQVVSGQEIDRDGVPHFLDDAALQECRERLQTLGGPPEFPGG